MGGQTCRIETSEHITRVEVCEVTEGPQAKPPEDRGEFGLIECGYRQGGKEVWCRTWSDDAWTGRPHPGGEPSGKHTIGNSDMTGRSTIEQTIDCSKNLLSEGCIAPEVSRWADSREHAGAWLGEFESRGEGLNCCGYWFERSGFTSKISFS